MLTRRSFCIKLVALSVVSHTCSRSVQSGITSRSRLPEYCSLEGNAKVPDEELLKSSGDRDLDSSMSLELFRASDVFNVRPGFCYIKERRQPNAYATKELRIPNTYDGTVIFGLRLLFQELQSHEWGGAAVAGILAHEFGHIYQYASGYDERLLENQSTKRQVELHADYMAGYYLGLKKREGSELDIKAFVDSIYLKGDTDFNNEKHHGTPLERERVMIQGYQLGIMGQIKIADVAQKGEEVVKVFRELS